MIITKLEVRELLQLGNDTSYDDLITRLIPEVQKDVIKKCNNYFLNTNVQLTASTITFNADGTITDSAEGFTDAKFFDGMDLKIFGTDLNDGVVEVATVTAGTLTLNTLNSLRSEASGEAITLTMVDFSRISKFDLAMIFKYYLAKEGKLVNNESLPGGWSGTYKTEREVWQPIIDKHRKPFP
jgi:hypothetical protein